jgi:hypothetical protein
MKKSAHKILFTLLFFFPITQGASRALALDCSKEEPFVTIGRLKVDLELARFSGSEQYSNDNGCKKDVIVTAFDVRGREEAAYYCLKPEPAEVVTCESELNKTPAWFTAVPVVWVRNSKGESLTEIRFHAYVQEKANPDAYIDIFSRTLSEIFPRKRIILEGASSYGPASPITENYWVRAAFQFPVIRCCDDQAKNRTHAAALSHSGLNPNACPWKEPPLGNCRQFFLMK